MEYEVLRLGGMGWDDETGYTGWRGFVWDFVVLFFRDALHGIPFEIDAFTYHITCSGEFLARCLSFTIIKRFFTEGA